MRVIDLRRLYTPRQGQQADFRLPEKVGQEPASCRHELQLRVGQVGATIRSLRHERQQASYWKCTQRRGDFEQYRVATVGSQSVLQVNKTHAFNACC